MQICCDELLRTMIVNRRKFPSKHQRNLARQMGQHHHVFRHAYGFLKDAESDSVSYKFPALFFQDVLTWALNHTSITVSHSQVWAVYERNCPPKLEVSSGIISSQISRIVRPNTGCLIHCKLFAIWIDLSLSYCFPQPLIPTRGWGESSYKVNVPFVSMPK